MRNVVLVADDGAPRGADTLSGVAGPSVATPKRSDLKYWVRSAPVTWSKSGVSPSYICAWSSAPAGGGTPPYWPEGMMLSDVWA